MAEVGIDLTGRTSKQLTDAAVCDSAVVVTTSGPDAVTVTGEQRHEDWPVEDVAGKDAGALRAIHDDIRARAEDLAAHPLPAPG
ncbi:hypothetical protein ACFYTG_08785 [Streptomyces mirabilis]|uniref:hypothetical protein n=1 Tax=Streptomyces mirabilis TaxID=68239 RepID=UPI0036B7AE2E